MATIGVDCQVVLDGTGYWVEPGTYQLHRPRVRRAVIVKGGSERYVDTGPGKRVWMFVALCLNELRRSDGQPVGITGQQYRDLLEASYAKVSTTLAFTDVHGVSVSVRFDDLRELTRDVRSQLVSPSYYIHVSLVEA